MILTLHNNLYPRVCRHRLGNLLMQGFQAIDDVVFLLRIWKAKATVYEQILMFK